MPRDDRWKDSLDRWITREPDTDEGYPCECGYTYKLRATRDHCRASNHGEPDHDT